MATPSWIAPEIAAHAPKLASVAPASEPTKRTFNRGVEGLRRSVEMTPLDPTDDGEDASERRQNEARPLDAPAPGSDC